MSVVTDTSIDLFGYTCDDLQDITLDGLKASGTLKYIADYSSAFPSGEDSGNYIVLKATTATGTTTTVEVVGGVHGPKALGDDGIVLARITSNTQTVEFVTTNATGDKNTKVIDLTGVELATE